MAALGKLAVILFAVWLLLGILPFFARIFGFAFLPSIEWMSKTNLPGLTAGLISAVLLFGLFLKGWDKMPGDKVKKTLAVLGAPFIGYALGRSVVVIVEPMILALIAGHQVELPFAVVNADHRGYTNCRSPVDLQGLPFLFDKVCRVPSDVRPGLSPGGRIIVIGHGTSLGVFAQSLRRVD
ncbi:hypothetical protein [Rhizobium leguminosarum]|uniref:hypothetical protein n=1 Tax=Rhizobium leguminosarum TaxID=384 RepID=UPI001C9386F7|nr:hypothetical protein [Rhizobium leguminosarum]MBY5581358.1 hypothetical protein [Rhizobium leguminosarum]MBY5607059.1 hypothetical protein [Rhizobium leguminosarum]MBY5653885.1 hypothetical protein [Rhizobium leguminosarum]MBY5667971.1 hypothetical protein [Rhizobium leguminosarum]MBY5681509.1 hypothetical protein [Rhizobium leguminosarum]